MLLSGCSGFAERAVNGVAKAVDKYCDEPLNYREVYYELINQKLSENGHYAEVLCYGDPVGEDQE